MSYEVARRTECHNGFGGQPENILGRRFGNGLMSSFFSLAIPFPLRQAGALIPAACSPRCTKHKFLLVSKTSLGFSHLS